MALRLTTEKPTPTDGDSGSPFEDHMYGFRSLVNRERALGGMQQVQKMICYCTDSTACTPDRLVNIGTLTITGGFSRRCLSAFPLQPSCISRTVHLSLSNVAWMNLLLFAQTYGTLSFGCL